MPVVTIVSIALVILLGGCGLGGNPGCEALTALEEIDQRFVEGDVADAIGDRDLEAMTVAFNAVADDAAGIRDDLAGLDQPGVADLRAAAGALVRGANLLDATFNAANIRQGDLDAGLDEIDDARRSLRDARRDLEECG